MYQDYVGQIQTLKLRRLLHHTWKHNRFYQAKWTRAGLKPSGLKTLQDFTAFPFTTREELVHDQEVAPPLGLNTAVDVSEFKHIYRSTGTTQQPLFWADTLLSWKWAGDCSTRLFSISGLQPSSRLFIGVPFGTSSGPWLIYEGGIRLSSCCFTCGQTDPWEQLAWLRRFKPDVLLGRPSHLLDLARLAGSSAASIGISKLIMSGVRETGDVEILERTFNAECFDRYGLTEAGSVAAECEAHPGGMHLLDTEFIPEVIDPGSGTILADGESGELVLTNLGRPDRPIIRYRTGDFTRLVRQHDCPCGRTEPLLIGGIHRLSTMSGNTSAQRKSSPPTSLNFL